MTAAVVVAACTAASTQSPGFRSIGPSQPSAAPSTALPTATALATSTPFAEPTSEPTPLWTDGPLPSVPAVPPGTWTGIGWLVVPLGHGPAASDTESPKVNLFGWSRGYVDFVWNNAAGTATPWASTDGLNWAAGPKLDTTAMVKRIPPEIRDSCRFQVAQFEEGPAGLLVAGDVVCLGAVCGPPWVSPDSFYLSPDGVSWSTAAAPGSEISAGSAGYIAADGTALWTSLDGKSWHKRATPNVKLPPQTSWSGVASFSGGFVVGAVVDWAGGCGMPLGPKIAAVWWSRDGGTWTRGELPGAAIGNGVEMAIDRIGDRGLLVRTSSWNDATQTEADQAWTSADGRTWTPLVGGDMLVGATIVTDGTAGLAVVRGAVVGDGSIYAFDAGLKLVLLSQTGTAPSGYPMSWALGPAGLLVTTDGIHFYIGVPTTA